MTDHSPHSTILVLHHSEIDPHAFLSRLANIDFDETNRQQHVPWRVDNKYYTADIAFRIHPLEHDQPWETYPVLLYLFSGPAPDPLPRTLTRLAVGGATPDIALAVRVGDRSESKGERQDPGQDFVDEEDRFDELGMEVVDECGDADEDDERPMDPLDTVRQTLMTHMWPNMKRKPMGPRRDMPRPELESDGSEDEEGGDNTTSRPAFPVTFSNGVTPDPARPSGPISDFPTPEPLPQSGEEILEFQPMPVVEPMYARIEDEEDEFGAFSSVDNGADGPSAAEYARLDHWLDEDEEEEEDEDEGEHTSHLPSQSPSTGRRMQSANGDTDANGTTPGFDDDFGPPSTLQGDAPALPLDPTPLLMHLQQVRADLALVEDEDERRVRAGHEVSRLMQSLGLGDLELEFDDDLDDLEFA